MKRIALIVAVFLAAGLVFADESDDKQEAKLKFPWAGKAMNQPVTMTKLELEVLKYNVGDLSADEKRLIVKGGKCVVGLTRLHIEAKEDGLVMTGECVFADPCKDMYNAAGSNILHHLWKSQSPLGRLYRKERFPVGVKVVYKGKVVHTKIYKSES